MSRFIKNPDDKVLNKKQNKHKGWVFLIGGDNLYVNYSDESVE
jgi:hypothetical protein